MSVSSGTLLLPRMESDDPNGCVDCAERIADNLRSIPGIVTVEVIPSPVRLSYTYQSTAINTDDVEAHATRALSSVSDHLIHRSLVIEGMDCDNCARTLERGVLRLPGVEHASVNFGSARLDLAYDSATVTIDSISRRVDDLGYAITDPGTLPEDERGALLRLLRRRDNVLASAAAILTLAGIAGWAAGAPAAASNLGYLAAIVIGGIPLALKGLRALRTTRSLDINLLMTIAVLGALAIGEWLEGAAVVALFSIGEALEGYAMDRARRSIRSLMTLTPATALVRRDGIDVEAPVADLVPGDIVTVRAGERVALDGVVLAGTSNVDQAALTGESVPVHKESGAALLAGTLNGTGPLIMQVTRLASDSSVARIIRLVERAQGERAPAQRLVDRFARVYTPAVIATALLIATVPPVFTGSQSDWFYRALVLLVIACPCALVISTPVSIVSALSAAARRGILVKGGGVLERAGKIDTIAFDKTGTLTTGKSSATSVAAFDVTEDALLSIAASLEAHSDHPLAIAIQKLARQRGIAVLTVTDEEVLPGIGLRATIDGERFVAGSMRMFERAGPPAGVINVVDSVEATGATAVLIGTNDRVLGVIGIADTPRPEAGQAVSRLRKLGVERLVMLSGDRQPAAAHVASAVHISDVRAGLLPEDKLDVIASLRGKDRTVAMVGDGINDAPALASADIGIAMGGGGTDVALETADIALMSDRLHGLADIIGLGRRTRRKIWTNITLSLAIKVVFLTLAVTGDATLWMAILADVGTSLIVIANGMLLLRWPQDRQPSSSPAQVVEPG
jgi:Zn2+/Cd2+-exporting ATPase